MKLDFPSVSLNLLPLRPSSFDNWVPPIARLADGPVEVFNVMTRRSRWTARVEILRQNARVTIGRNEIGVIFVADGEWIAKGGGETCTLQNGGTAIISQPGDIALSASAAGAAILAWLTPVSLTSG